MPLVPAAILFDLANGGDKGWDGEPLPRASAPRRWRPRGRTSRLGSEGAGTGAMTATLMGGLGSASFVTEAGTTVGALVAVNAFGSVIVPGTRAFWAGAWEIGDEFGGLGPAAVRVAPFTPRPMKPGHGRDGANTTLAIVATDLALDKAGAGRLAEVAHAGLARAIHPVHTPFDGDLVFGVSTGGAAGRPAGGDGGRPCRGDLPDARGGARGPRRAADAGQPAALLERDGDMTGLRSRRLSPTAGRR